MALVDFIRKNVYTHFSGSVSAFDVHSLEVYLVGFFMASYADYFFASTAWIFVFHLVYRLRDSSRSVNCIGVWFYTHSSCYAALNAVSAPLAFLRMHKFKLLCVCILFYGEKVL